MNYYEETAYYYCMNAHYGVCPFSSTNKCNGYAYLDSTCQLEKALDNTILSKEMIIKIHLGKAKLNGLVASHYCQIYGFQRLKNWKTIAIKAEKRSLLLQIAPQLCLIAECRFTSPRCCNVIPYIIQREKYSLQTLMSMSL